ncbi:hypothetical protein SAMN04487782_0105 [Stenotrophomonas maltophilia]|nr:hypothetical protein SAMN04487782_0105 [Stenotrophomonas maltophilia]
MVTENGAAAYRPVDVNACSCITEHFSCAAPHEGKRLLRGTARLPALPLRERFRIQMRASDSPLLGHACRRRCKVTGAMAGTQPQRGGGLEQDSRTQRRPLDGIQPAQRRRPGCVLQPGTPGMRAGQRGADVQQVLLNQPQSCRQRKREPVPVQRCCGVVEMPLDLEKAPVAQCGFEQALPDQERIQAAVCRSGGVPQVHAQRTTGGLLAMGGWIGGPQWTVHLRHPSRIGPCSAGDFAATASALHARCTSASIT